MVTDVGDSEGVAAQPFTGVEVRAQLIKYLAHCMQSSEFFSPGRRFVDVLITDTTPRRFVAYPKP